MGTQSDFRVKKNLIVGDGIISSGDNANLVLRRDFDDTTYNQITLNDDTFKITLDGSDRLFIDGNGKVGLGVTTPDERLDVRNSATPKLLVRTTATSSQEAHIIIGGARTTSTTADISRVIFNTYDSDIGGNESNTLAEITVRKQTASSDQGNLLFKTNSGDNNISEAMRIDKDGNVGIGTTSPGSYKLVVEETTNPQLRLQNPTNAPNGWDFRVGDTGSLIFKDDGTERVRFASDGNVGIGTTSPTGKLTVTSAGHDIIHLNRTVNNEGWGAGIIGRLGNDASTTAAHEYAAIFFQIEDNTDGAEAGSIAFNTSSGGTAADSSSTHAMQITSAGNVGIGTTAPVAPLEIKTSAYNSGGYKSHLLIVDQTAYDGTNNGGAILLGGKEDSGGNLAYWAKISGEKANTTADDRSGTLHFWTRKEGGAPTQRMIIDEDGYVGIGTTAPTNTLHLSDDSRVDIKFTRASHEDHYIRKDGHYLRIRGHDDSTILMEIRNNSSSNHISFPNSNIGIGTTTPGYALDIQKADAKINLKDTSDTDDMYVRYEGNDNNEYGLVGYDGSAVFQIKSTQGRVINLGGHANVKVGVTTADMTFTPSALFHVNGALKATTKSFDIEHPTKEGMRLHHGVLEGPEHGVYIRGHQVGETIELPDYWLGLVDEDTITVQLTAKGRTQNLYVKSVDREKVVVGGFITKSPDFYYFIQAERKDVDKMEVEYGIVH